MDTKDKLWTLVFVSGICIWLYFNLELDPIDYSRHQDLINQTTGEKLKPKDLIDMSKIINITQEYIDTTNAMDRLYDLEFVSNLENPFTMDQRYSELEQLRTSGWPVSNKHKCSHELNWIWRQLEAHKNYSLTRGQIGFELTNFMDSYGRPSNGLYSGTVYWPGSYKGCQRATLRAGQIKGRYCFARLRPKSWPRRDTINPSTSFRFGICLPETCDTSSFEENRHLIEALTKYDYPEFYKTELEVNSIMCLPDERSPIRRVPTGGWIYLAVLAVWTLIVLVATLAYEYLPKQKVKLASLLPTAKQLEAEGRPSLAQFENHQNEQNNDRPATIGTGALILDALSLRCSLKSFKTNIFRVKYNQGQRVKANLAGMDFIKVCMAFFVVLAHSSYLSLIYSRNLSNKVELATSEPGKMVLSVGRCVDTFFIFFGILTTYTLMRKFDLKQLANPLIWFGTNVGVLFRVAPMFMLVYWFSKLVAPYTGSGPWWDYGIDTYSLKGVCMREPWYKAIPYLGSLGSPAVPACNLPSWFIISYVQISLILPLLTYLLCKLPNYASRLALTGFLLLVSSVSIGVRLIKQSSIKDEGFTLYGAYLSDLLEKFESTGHMSTLGRVGSVAVGCFLGYLMRQYEESRIRRWPKWLTSKAFNVLVALLHVLIILLPMIGHRIYHLTGALVSKEQFVISNSILMVAWPILNGILILSLATTYNHIAITRFFAHTVWHVINRLGFGIFLVHWEIIFLSTTAFEEAPTYGYASDVLRLWAFALLLAIALALLIHLVIEVPLSKLLLIVARFALPGPRRINNQEIVASVQQQQAYPMDSSDDETTVGSTTLQV